MSDLQITVVPDSEGTCPGCGAYWGHPDKALDFPNRSKVHDEHGWWWKCYNPACPVAYWVPGTDLWEQVPNEEQRARIAEATAKRQVHFDHGTWTSTKLDEHCTEARFVPAPDCPCEACVEKREG